jgi:hypothetical protein
VPKSSTSEPTATQPINYAVANPIHETRRAVSGPPSTPRSIVPRPSAFGALRPPSQEPRPKGSPWLVRTRVEPHLYAADASAHQFTLVLGCAHVFEYGEAFAIARRYPDLRPMQLGRLLLDAVQGQRFDTVKDTLAFLRDYTRF